MCAFSKMSKNRKKKQCKVKHEYVKCEYTYKKLTKSKMPSLPFSSTWAVPLPFPWKGGVGG